MPTTTNVRASLMQIVVDARQGDTAADVLGRVLNVISLIDNGTLTEPGRRGNA